MARILKQVFGAALILVIVFTGAHLTQFNGGAPLLAGQKEYITKVPAPPSGISPEQRQDTLVHAADRAVLAALEGGLKKRIASSGCQVELCLYDFALDEWIQLEAQRSFYPASMIKTLLLLTALDQAQQGTFSLESPYRLKESDKYAGETPVTGTGILQYAEAGTLYTSEELLNLMVGRSDNVATNIIFEQIGAKSCASMAQKLGLKNSAFTRKMYDLNSKLPSNKSTAFELTQMLVALQNREIAGEMLTRKGIEMMAATEDKGRIGRYLESPVVVANKVGTVSGVVGDMALVYFPERPPLALTVVVENQPIQEEASALIGELANLIVTTLVAGI